MNLFEFTEWIKDLDLQTLTDELKEEIYEQAEVMYLDAKEEGYEEAKADIIEHINYHM
jgi:hypothetical protein